MIPNLSSLLKSFLVRIWWLLGIKKRRRWRLFLWGKRTGEGRELVFDLWGKACLYHSSVVWSRDGCRYLICPIAFRLLWTSSADSLAFLPSITMPSRIVA